MMLNYKDDFYNTVNYDWLKSRQLDKTKTHIDNFSELSDKIDSYLYSEVNNWINTGDMPQGYGVDNFFVFYKQALNFEKRERQGVDPLIKVLNKYITLDSFEDYISELSSLESLGLPNLLPFYVAPDILDSSKNMVWIGSPDFVFPESSYYDYESDQGKYLLDTWHKCQKELLEEIGFSSKESDDILYKVIELDRLTITQSLTSTPDSSERYNLYTFDDLQKLVPSIPLKRFFEELIGEVPKEYIVSDESFWKGFASQFYSKEMWEYLKAKLIYGVVTMYSSCLTKKIKSLSSKFRDNMLGITTVEDHNRNAYELTQFALGADLNYWYSEQWLSREERSDVKELVNIIIREFRKQIENSLHVTEEGKQKIINKLDNINVQIGGPNNSSVNIMKLSIEDTLVENINTILENSSRISWNSLCQSIERNRWSPGMLSYTVDAYYHAQSNGIVLPAGILQKPFYSSDYSFIKNLSRIGFLIAHEISHAFDNDGSMFDEYGNYKNWLPNDDKDYFQSISNMVRKKYSNQRILDFTINGDLTLSENMADISGFSCIENLVVNLYPGCLEEFYINFTKLWRIVERPEYLKMLTLSDPHAPSKIRVNNLLSNSKRFIQFYRISEKDMMWIEENERITIW